MFNKFCITPEDIERYLSLYSQGADFYHDDIGFCILPDGGIEAEWDDIHRKCHCTKVFSLTKDFFQDGSIWILIFTPADVIYQRIADVLNDYFKDYEWTDLPF